MNRETITELRVELLDALNVDIDNRGRRERIEQEVFALTDLLPEPEAWAAIDKGDDTARAVLLAADSLFTLAPLPETGQLAAASCSGRVLEATCWRGEYEPASEYGPGWRTYWVFGLHHQDDELRISGFVTLDGQAGTHTPNRAERLARALANRAGWTGPTQ